MGCHSESGHEGAAAAPSPLHRWGCACAGMGKVQPSLQGVRYPLPAPSRGGAQDPPPPPTRVGGAAGPGSRHAHTDEHRSQPARLSRAEVVREGCPSPHTTESWISEPRRTRGLWQAGDTSTKLSRTWRGRFSDSEKARVVPGGSCTGVLTM